MGHYTEAQSKLEEVGVARLTRGASCDSHADSIQVEAYGQKIADEMEKLNAMETDENRE